MSWFGWFLPERAFIQDDAEALRSDWEAVGDDLRGVISE